MVDTTAMTKFMSRTFSIPEIQPKSGIFLFELTWNEIQSLKPQIANPCLRTAMRFYTSSLYHSFHIHGCVGIQEKFHAYDQQNRVF